jgi:DNA-binding MarR family transcriptional regulator
MATARPSARTRYAPTTREPAPGTRLASVLFHLEQLRRVVEHSSRLNVADGRLLWLFRDHVPRTLRQIAEELGLEQSTVNRQVNAARQAGLLDRSRAHEGGAYVFQASEDGLTTFEAAIASSLGQYDDALATLGADDAERLISLLERFVAAYGEVVDGADPRR